MKNLFAAALCAACHGVSTSARAWWDMGHMKIAAVAYHRLEPAARARVGALLRLNPDYETWVAGVPADQRDRTAFIHAATWADDIKRRRDYDRASIAQDGAEAAANIGYADHKVHDYWHYVDLPFADGAPGHEPEAPNALTQIEAFRKTLASDAADEVKSYDLVWLLHLVGDVHQPLHATSRFSRALPQGDQGGNKETICLAFTCGAKLHAYWDALLGDKGAADDAAALAASLPDADPQAAENDDARSWISDSKRLAEQFVYTPAIGDGTGPFTLDSAYQARRQAPRPDAGRGGRRAAREADQCGAEIGANGEFFRSSSSVPELTTSGHRRGSVDILLLCRPLIVV